MAVKRNRGHLSQVATLDTLEADFVRQTLCEWEHKLASNLMLGSRLWFQQVDSQVREDVTDSHHMICFKGNKLYICGAAESSRHVGFFSFPQWNMRS